MQKANNKQKQTDAQTARAAVSGVIRTRYQTMRLAIGLMFLLFTQLAFSKELLVISVGDLESDVNLNINGPYKIYEEPSDEVTGMCATREYIYKGASLNFTCGNNGYYLWRIEYTSKSFAYLNEKVVVGASKDEVQGVLGKPVSQEDGGSSWLYRLPGGDGWVKITFNSGAVSSVLATEDWT